MRARRFSYAGTSSTTTGSPAAPSGAFCDRIRPRKLAGIGFPCISPVHATQGIGDAGIRRGTNFAMSIADYFRKTRTARPEEVQETIRTSKPGEYLLIDVRTPREYQAGHLPGARSIPLNELPNRLSEIDRDLPLFVY